MNSNERQKKSNIKELTAEQQEESHLSALAINGRVLLKGFYMRYQLLRENEEEKGIENPDYSFLQVLPALHTVGLKAAHTYLVFSADGIAIADCEGLYAHNSREKFALLYLIMQFEIGKRFTLNVVIRDELIQIKRLNDLVFWINLYNNDKDFKNRLEKKIRFKPTFDRPLKLKNEVKEAKYLDQNGIAKYYGVCARTIQRNSEKYPFIMVGRCKKYSNPDYNKN